MHYSSQHDVLLVLCWSRDECRRNLVCVSYVTLRVSVLDIKHMAKWNQSEITLVYPFTYGWRLGTGHVGSLFRETHRKLMSFLQCFLHYKAIFCASRQCTARRDFLHYTARLILKLDNSFMCSLQEILDFVLVILLLLFILLLLLLPFSSFYSTSPSSFFSFYSFSPFILLHLFPVLLLIVLLILLFFILVLLLILIVFLFLLTLILLLLPSLFYFSFSFPSFSSLYSSFYSSSSSSLYSSSSI